MPQCAFVGLPVVVVDGPLFEAYYDERTGKVEVSPVDIVRLHWRGAEAWGLHATVDVVQSGYLEKFIEDRGAEVPLIMEALMGACENISQCFTNGNLSELELDSASRGIKGLPPLLVPLAIANKHAVDEKT